MRTAKYLVVGAVLAGFLATLVAVVRTTSVSSSTSPSAASLIQPIVALVILTGIVWVMMVVYRNIAIIRGAASERYFKTYTAEHLGADVASELLTIIEGYYANEV